MTRPPDWQNSELEGANSNHTNVSLPCGLTAALSVALVAPIPVAASVVTSGPPARKLLEMPRIGPALALLATHITQ